MYAARGAKGRCVAAARLFTIPCGRWDAPCRGGPRPARVPCWLWRHDRASRDDAYAERHPDGYDHVDEYSRADGHGNQDAHCHADGNADPYCPAANRNADPHSPAANRNADPDTDLDAEPDTDAHPAPNSDSDGDGHLDT